MSRPAATKTRPRLNPRSAVKFAWDNFGPLILFYGTNHFYGLKAAIAVSTLGAILEIAYKLWKKEPITTIFKFTVAMTLIFGAVDLYSQESFLFKYEPAITSLLTGGFFIWSMRGGRSLLQDFYNASPQAKERPLTRDLIGYFRLVTVVWTGYFVLKAGAYVWMAQVYTIEQGLLIRTLVGTVSLYVMLGITLLAGRFLFPTLQRRGWLRL